MHHNTFRTMRVNINMVYRAILNRIDLLAKRLVGGIILLILISSAHATTFEIHVFADSKLALHQHFISKVKSHLTVGSNDNLQYSISIINNVDSNQIDTAKPDAILVLGTRSAKIFSETAITSHVIYGLVPSKFYKKRIATSTSCKQNNCTAIFIDQPLARSVKLAKLALPNTKAVGLLVGEKSNIPAIKEIANQHSLTLEARLLTNQKDLVHTLSDILANADSLLTYPDPTIYNSWTAQNILLTAYRHKKPVIGYSKSFIKAGALLGVYSTPSQLAQQTSDMILSISRKKETEKFLPTPQYPKYYTVSVNQMVAKSLGIQIESEHKLKAALKVLENE